MSEPVVTESIVALESVRKSFGQREILKGISFDIQAGTIAALCGPSGSGKSTLLRIMVGLETFDAGSVRIADARLEPGAATGSNAGEHRKLHLQAGFVFQQWNLFPHMSALENVCEAPMHVRKTPRKEALERAHALLDKVGLAHRAHAMPRRMSGGEQQRCAIARALAMEPRVLFMDEPTSALDPARVGELTDLLLALSDSALGDDELTLIVVTHEMRFAAKVADRALVLHEGEVIEDGAPAAVLDAPTDPRTRKFLDLD